MTRRLAWLGPLALALLFVALARWTWGAWPDVLVDFGRELYVPWRLAAGDVLQRDIAWFNGPLSQHFNALLFRLAGVSLATLVWTNLTLLALFTGLWWSLLARLAGALSAGVACAVLLCVFAFAQLVGIANYNFIAPYSHEVTHGMLLATACLWTLVRWESRRGLAGPVVAGLLLGLCFLTKAEVFLAAAAACAVYLALALRSEREPAVPPAHSLAFFLAGLLLPPAYAFFAGYGNLGAGGSLRAVCGAWVHVLGGGASELAFYRSGMGLDAPRQRLIELAAWSGRWILVLGPCALLAARLRRGGEAAAACAAGALLFAAGLAAYSFRRPDWLAALRPLPLFVALIGAAALALVRRGATSDEAPELARRARAVLALCVFALVLLLKMLLNARAQHYGFALALPGTLLVVCALVGWLPEWLDRRGAAGGVLRAGALGLLTVGTLAHLDITRGMLARKPVQVGTGADAFRSDLRGRFVNSALELYSEVAGPGDTLAVLPEGVMLNYLAQSVNPTPYVNFMPPELLFFGEQAMLERFEATPPDWILLVHKDTSEYGYPLFGPDYGTRLATWIQQSYVPIRQFGQPPLMPGTVFGIQLMRRR